MHMTMAAGTKGRFLRLTGPKAGGFLSLTGLWPEGCGGGFAANYKNAAPPSPSFRPKRSGVKKSHFPMVHETLRQEIFRLRASSERFPSAPIPARSPALDDDDGGHQWTRPAGVRVQRVHKVQRVQRIVVAPFGAQRTHFEGALATRKM